MVLDACPTLGLAVRSKRRHHVSCLHSLPTRTLRSDLAVVEEKISQASAPQCWLLGRCGAGVEGTSPSGLCGLQEVVLQEQDSMQPARFPGEVCAFDGVIGLESSYTAGVCLALRFFCAVAFQGS